MQLRDYLHKNRIKKNEFALKIRCSFGYLGRICEYLRRPSMRIAEDIEQATGGVVTIEDLMSADYESDKK